MLNYNEMKLPVHSPETFCFLYRYTGQVTNFFHVTWDYPRNGIEFPVHIGYIVHIVSMVYTMYPVCIVGVYPYTLR